jgi:opacity protein-like surface antigen
MNARLARSLSVAALPLVTGGWLAVAAAPAAADDSSGGPRYSYFDAGYQWVDVNYAVKQEGGQHEGIKLNGSVAIANFGAVGLHLFGEFFDGEFTGANPTCDGGTDGESITFSGTRDSQSLAGGLGISYRLAENTDVVARGAYVDITKFEIPNDTCNLVDVTDNGYFAEGMIRSELSENVEIEAGYRYSDLSDSDIGNSDVLLGLGYHVNDYLTLRVRGIVFDNDTGLELSARLYFGSFLGRDAIF